ncbi:YcnI family protein, partial [Bradyrhizobium sp. STM 3809]|uniref:YcnI family protein n=1 Tax=Bradyrhizobium sp. STM 3809 TaxID=551936 RepID=UPI0005511D36
MKSLALTLAVLSVACFGSLASAHVVLDKPEARIGKTFKAVLAVPHGCEGSPSVRLTVQVPEGLIAIKPMPKPGWTIELKTGAYGRAYDFMHGAKLSEGVKEISWSGRLEDGYYDEFTFTGFVADTFKAGDVLPIPAIQDCEKGTAKWVETAAPGQDPHALKYPAPLLRLTSAEPPPRGVAK